MRTSESLKELLPAFIAARQAFGPVRRENTAQIGQTRSYAYADLATVVEAVLQPLLDHGLVVVQVVDAETSTLVTRLLHRSGEWLESSYPLQLDQPPQGLGSALTYGRRYSLLALFNLAAEDDDGATAQPAKRPPREAARTPSTATPDGTPPVPPADTRVGARRVISEAQVKRLWAIAKATGWPREAVKDYLVTTYGVSTSADLDAAVYDAVIAHLQAGPPPTVPNDLAF